MAAACATSRSTTTAILGQRSGSESDLYRSALIDNCLAAADTVEVNPHGELPGEEELWVGEQNQGTGVAEQAHVVTIRLIQPRPTLDKEARQPAGWLNDHGRGSGRHRLGPR